MRKLELMFDAHLELYTIKLGESKLVLTEHEAAMLRRKLDGHFEPAFTGEEVAVLRAVNG